MILKLKVTFFVLSLLKMYGKMFKIISTNCRSFIHAEELIYMVFPEEKLKLRRSVQLLITHIPSRGLTVGNPV